MTVHEDRDEVEIERETQRRVARAIESLPVIVATTCKVLQL